MIPHPNAARWGLSSAFSRNILRIAGGAVFAQMIMFAAMPMLTRLYRPDDFGALAVFIAVHGILASLSTLKFDHSIILAPDDGKAVELTALTLASATIISLLVLAVACAVSLVSTLRPAWYYFLLPVTAVLTASFTCAQQWGARASNYRRYARSQWIGALANVVFALLIALVAQPSPGMLIVAYALGLAVSTLYLCRGAFISRLRDARHAPGLSAMALRKTAFEYRRFPLFVLPSSLMAIFSQTGQPFLLRLLFPLRDVGLFAVANRVLAAPISLIGGAISEAFRAEFVARMRAGDNTSRFFRRTLGKLLAIGLPMFAVAWLVSPYLFSWMFGEAYYDAGVVARHLCGAALAQFVSQPFAYVFVATDYLRVGLLVQLVSAFVPMAGLLAGGIVWDLLGAVGLFSVLSVACAALLIGLSYRCCVARDTVVRVTLP